VLKKILKSKVFTHTIFWLIVSYVFLVRITCRQEVIFRGGSEKLARSTDPMVLPCWHSRFMMFLPIKEFGSFHAVTSAHNDGNYLQMALKHYGHKSIRGSSRKKATDAMRTILSIGRDNTRLVVTPDGPIGPRFKIKGGVVRIAQKLDIPILPFSYSATHAIVLKTWDRFIIPIPFISKIVMVWGPVIKPNDLSSSDELSDVMLEQTKEVDNLCNLKVDY